MAHWGWAELHEEAAATSLQCVCVTPIAALLGHKNTKHTIPAQVT